MRKFHAAFSITLVFLSLAFVGARAQNTPPASRPAAQISDRDLTETQNELLRLLRMSPKLTTVVEHDPSLLSNQDYVSHNNPALAQFLQTHPDVARNPEFYLFNNVGSGDGRTEQALERKVWPELPTREEPWASSNEILPLFVFVCVLSALLWLIRLLLENRRWSRIFKLQTDVHGKLIDRFSTSQELLSYMETEPGKRFLQAAPIPVDFEKNQPVPSPVARVLTPLQIGIVLTLVGTGCMYLRHSLTQNTTPLLVFGTLALAVGIGFIISAGVTWLLAQHLGLMPQASGQEEPRSRQ